MKEEQNNTVLPAQESLEGKKAKTANNSGFEENGCLT